jgi:GT2 family glycosyltransferase
VSVDGRDVALVLDVRPYGDDARAGRLLIGHLPRDVESNAPQTTVTVRTGGEERFAAVPEFMAGAPGLRALLRNELTGLEADERRALLEFILGATSRDVREAGGLTLARRLNRVRDALREQLPRAAVTEDQPYAAHVDGIYAVDHESFWVKGWAHDEDQMLESLVAVSPEGGRGDVLSGAYRHSRIDIEELFGGGGTDVTQDRHGLIKFVQLGSSSRMPEGWLLELRTASGVGLEVEMPDVERSIHTVRARLLGDMAAERPGEDELLRDQVHPALGRIQRRFEDAVEIDRVVEIGEGHPSSPQTSVIVPLYKRIDFVEHQLAHFSRDPELGAADLVYVLDSPEIADNLLDVAHAVSRLHRIPLRVVLMRQNAGFSGVNNAAVSVARGRRILLLNSDVIPDRPGWLGKMSAFYDATPDIGALGPKLLYEDDSLQHAGLYFYRMPGSRLWGNQHYYKGLHRSFPGVNVARTVPAVTAACMMVDRDLYEQAGGLSHAYVQGGYEDSDLCLRLMELGRQNWYMPGAELYHLEAQSYPSEMRKLATRYNMWLHTHLWGDRIEEVSKEYGRPAAAGKDSVVAEPSR